MKYRLVERTISLSGPIGQILLYSKVNLKNFKIYKIFSVKENIESKNTEVKRWTSPYKIWNIKIFFFSRL